MMRALQRALGAPGLILTIFAFQLLLATTVSSSVRVSVGAALGKYAVLADGHLLNHILELLIDHPAIAAGSAAMLAGSSMLGLVLWTLLAAGIIQRLHSPTSPSEVAAAAIRGLPGVIAMTLWQLVPRMILLAIAAAISGWLMKADTWGFLGVLPLVAMLGYVTCALDLARCNVVLHGARRLHVKTALDGFVQAARRPRVLLPSMVFSACQWACVVAILGIAIAGLGTGWAIWVARCLALLGIVFGLSRVAVAVAVGAERPIPPAEPSAGYTITSD